jgi:3-hydroxybutyrate dehydrogenase
MTLSGKRVLITGGGTGVGADLARGFSEAGATVVITGRRLETLQAVAVKHNNVSYQIADVTREPDVVAMFKAAGPCDIVIANAGAAGSAPFGKTSLEQWNAMIAVNLTGTFLTLREGLNQMQGWGRLITIASIAGLEAYPYVSAYVAAKHGVVGLTKSIALEIAKKPITANAICPGYIDTEMTDRSIENIMQKTGRSRAQALASLEAMNPHGRLIAPSEITEKALWLCGPNSDGVNGQAISIPGDAT